jgi:hypothetical protein
MALVSANAAKGISDAHNVHIDVDGRTTEDGVYVKPPASARGIAAAGAAKSYHDYAKAGTLVGLNATGSSPSFIEGALNGIPDGGSGADALAQAFADFWSAFAISSGVPAHGGNVWVSASNDAAGKVGAFKAAISSSYTTSRSTPDFKSLIDNVEVVVKTIVWTTIELDTSVPKTVVGTTGIS